MIKFFIPLPPPLLKTMITSQLRRGVPMELTWHTDTTDDASREWNPTSPAPLDMIGWLVSLCIRGHNTSPISCVVIVDKAYSFADAKEVGRRMIFEKIDISYLDEECFHDFIGYKNVKTCVFKTDHPEDPVVYEPKPAGWVKPCIDTDPEWKEMLTRWTCVTDWVTCEPICANQVRIV